VRIYDRAQGVCHICKLPIKPNETWHADHVKALIEGGENREGNLAPAHAHCNLAKADEEKARKSKVAKTRKKHLGITRPKQSIPGRGFARSEKPAKQAKPTLPPILHRIGPVMNHVFRRCSIEGCEGDANPYAKGARGMCGRHYTRWRRHGDPQSGYADKMEATNWLHNTAVPYTGDDCLTWPFRKNIYGRAVIGSEGRSKQAHRWICEIVHGEPPTPKHHAAHSCGKGHEACVNPNHLRWATAKENFADKVVHGTNQCGERHGCAKLTEEQVLEIRRRSAAGETNAALSKEFGVVPSAIWNIFNRKRWAHLNPNDQEVTHD
jgi:hypothetical protein